MPPIDYESKVRTTIHTFSPSHQLHDFPIALPQLQLIKVYDERVGRVTLYVGMIGNDTKIIHKYDADTLKAFAAKILEIAHEVEAFGG